MSLPTRSYSNGEITVEWRPEKCIHCQACITGLPAVFNLERRPWVDMKAAATNEIKIQVASCPSGALAIKEQP